MRKTSLYRPVTGNVTEATLWGRQKPPRTRSAEAHFFKAATLKLSMQTNRVFTISKSLKPI